MRLHLESLAGIVVNAAEQDQRYRIPVLVDSFENVFGAKRRLTLAGGDLDQVLARIEAVEPDLRFHRVLVRGERAALDHNFASRARGAVKRDHQQVEINGERIHYHGLDRLCANQAGHLFGEEFVIRQPGMLRVKMAFDAKRLPVFKLLLDIPARGFWLQAERVTGEINYVLACGGPGHVKFFAKEAKRVLLVRPGGERSGILEIILCLHFIWRRSGRNARRSISIVSQFL